jgi:hypothetical protein
LSRVHVTKSLLYLHLIERVLVDENIHVQGRIQQCETLIPELSAEDMTKLVHIIKMGALPIPIHLRIPLFDIILRNLLAINADSTIITEIRNLMFRSKVAGKLLKTEGTQVTWHLFLEDKVHDYYNDSYTLLDRYHCCFSTSLVDYKDLTIRYFIVRDPQRWLH